jgi:hypothetical protein
VHLASASQGSQVRVRPEVSPDITVLRLHGTISCAELVCARSKTWCDSSHSQRCAYCSLGSWLTKPVAEEVTLVSPAASAGYPLKSRRMPVTWKCDTASFSRDAAASIPCKLSPCQRDIECNQHKFNTNIRRCLWWCARRAQRQIAFRGLWLPRSH